MRHILGISAYYHDAAAALLSEGKIVAAAQEEHCDAAVRQQALEVLAQLGLCGGVVFRARVRSVVPSTRQGGGGQGTPNG